MTYQSRRTLKKKLTEAEATVKVLSNSNRQPRVDSTEEIALRLIVQLEPALLDKYGREYLEGTNGNIWGLREWDVEGMERAIEFRINSAAAEKYSEPAVTK